MAIGVPSLIGARAKRARAQHHFDTLEKLVRNFFDNYESDTVVVPDEQRNRYFVRLRNPSPIPEREWATIIGDCVHNLRSLFDYIAWELAGGDLTDRETQFPVCNSEQTFNTSGRQQIHRLPPEAQTFIEQMQPYHAQARHGAGSNRHFLRTLHLLDVADKHKLLTPTLARVRAASSMLPEGFSYQFYLIPDAPIADGADFAEVVFPEGFVPDAQIPDVDPVLEIAFAESVGLGGRVFVLSELRKIMEQVDTSITQFDEEFFHQQ